MLIYLRSFVLTVHYLIAQVKLRAESYSPQYYGVLFGVYGPYINLHAILPHIII